MPRRRAATGQGKRLDVLVELGRFGQTDHDEAALGGTVGPTTDDEVSFDVLLCGLVHSEVIVSKKVSEARRSEKPGTHL